MNWKDLKLKKKFYIAFGSIVAILVIISLFSVNGIDSIMYYKKKLII